MQRTSLHIYIEKFISMVLRHSPETIEVQMSTDGWVNVEELILKINSSKHLKNIVLNPHILNEVVLLSPKQRFSYSLDNLSIRANQGHSLKNLIIDFTEVKDIDVLYHGSTIKNIKSIKENGLLKMSRNYVHLSSTVKVATEVGKRYGKVIVFEVNIRKMRQDGFKLYKSDNNVYLVDHIPYQYLKIIQSK